MPRATDILPVVVAIPEAHPRRNGQADKVTAHDPSPAQLLDHVRARLSHEPTLPPLGSPGAPPGRALPLTGPWSVAGGNLTPRLSQNRT